MESLPHVEESTVQYSTESSASIESTATSPLIIATPTHRSHKHATRAAQHQNRNSQISTSNQTIGTINYQHDSLQKQGSTNNSHGNKRETRDITNTSQRKSARTKARRTEQKKSQLDSSINEELTELRPSSTIGRSKCRGLLSNWEKIFKRNRETIQQTASRKEKSFIQPKLHYNQEENKAVGENILDPPKSDDIETIWFHNINGMKDE
jgi:hypothetical protein